MSIYYHQLNVCNLDCEIKNIKNISQNKKNILIGLEVTLKELSNNLTFNIDPQHTWKKKTTTCLEEFKDLLPNMVKFVLNKDLHLFFLKPDLDSISAAAILDIYLDNPTWLFQDEIRERINAIVEYDRHGRGNVVISPNVRIPRGLFMYVSGWKNNIYDKIKLTKTWLLDGTFKGIYQYNCIANKKFKQSLFNSKVEILLPKKLVFVKSMSRGACGIGYRYAPITIALNPSYRFGIDEVRTYGKKWIIAQKQDTFLDMAAVLYELQLIEPGWGGSPSIIGSPQDRPSKILKDDIVEIIKEKILVR